jgi:AraC-like DNA-binding protein
MKRIQLSGTDLNENFLIISNELKGELSSDGGCSYAKFSNEYCKGQITGVRVSDEISALIFDVVFSVEIEFEYSNQSKEIIDLFYCLEGSFKHKTDSDREFENINFRQNSLVKRLKSSQNTISFVPHKSLKMSFISYSILDASESRIKGYYNLREMASSSLETIATTEDFRYLGRICFRTSTYVRELMPFMLNNASDILFKEAAILNTLASQLDRYENDSNSKHANAPIKQYELDKIIAIGVFVQQNLSENLTINSLVRMSGLGPSKLQMGFNYLYETSVNNYITEKRLEKAAELLHTNEMNISEIVYQIGFNSRSYFSKIFKRRYGISPSDALTKSLSS